MKYRLKKDLPFAKAGDLIYNYEGNLFNSEGNFDCFVRVDKAIFPAVYLYPKNNMAFIGDKRDLMGEWIEEAKPREWDISIINGIIPTWYTTDADAKIEKIKVREVLD